MKCAGIVLCGGLSKRMGLPKATLPFGPELMLERVVRLLGEAVKPIVVVAAAGQELPKLPSEVLLVRDERSGRGPLEGLQAGLAALEGRATAAYATSCDVPLLSPKFVQRVIELTRSGDWQIGVPRAEGYHHPLAAVYSLDVLPTVRQLLVEDRLRPIFLFDAAPTRIIGVEELRPADPELHSLRNLNHPADYLAALTEAGFEAPEDVLAKLNPSVQ